MEISRRDFIRKMTALGFTAAAAGAMFNWMSCSPAGNATTAPPEPSTSELPPPVTALTPPQISGTYLAVARGTSPRAITEAAVKSLGGIEKFVKPGNDVIIKPNICVAYHSYEYAATTNPEVVSTLVSLCKGAGARRVRVMDQPFGGTAEQAYAISGIGDAVRAAGGQMETMSNVKFKNTPIAGGIDIQSWPIYQDVLDADVVINVPIAKHHSLARLTLGMKNLMGVVLNRNLIHYNIGQKLADLSTVIKPSLTIVDCVRILMNNGPTGGSLNDVKLTNTIIASQDVVVADAYATTLFGLTGQDISYIRAAAQMGLGIMDPGSVKIEEINV
jgi:uncharacterized protein (DUF362 family)